MCLDLCLRLEFQVLGKWNERDGLDSEDANSLEKPKVTNEQMGAAMIDAMLDALVAAFASLPRCSMPSTGASAQSGLSPVVMPPVYVGEEAAFAWAAAPIAFSHSDGCLTRRTDAAKF